MAIIDVRTEGDLLNCGADAITIPVNCFGTPGKGLAKQFADLAPRAAMKYKQMCRTAWRPGTVRVVQSSDKLDPGIKHVVLFPTKNHWRHDSRLEWIEQGLDDMMKLFDVQAGGLEANTIAVPALGCGEGGLSWTDVEPLIVDKLRGMYAVSRVIVFSPRTT